MTINNRVPAIIQLSRVMSHLSYQLLINLRQLDVIGIRQSSFFQIRVTVMQTTSKQENQYAVPFLMMKSEPQKKYKPLRNNTDPSNTSQIDEHNSFLSRKFIIRNVDENVSINEMCLFKGTLSLDEHGRVNRELKIYIELITHQQSQAEIVTDWEGHTFGIVGGSFLPVYFNSYKCTCNLNCTLHAVTSTLSLQTILQNGSEVSQLLVQLKNNGFLKKYSQELEFSIQMLKKQLGMLHAKIDDIAQLKEVLLEPQTYRYALFRKKNLTKNLDVKQVAKMEEEVNQMGVGSFLQAFKKYIHALNQINFQLWKKLQLSLISQYNEHYERQIKAQYNIRLNEYHRITSYLQQTSEKTIAADKKSELFAYAFEKHETFIRASKEVYKIIQTRKPSIRKQVLVFVHGYQASSFDMEPLSNYLKHKYNNVIPLLSSVNEGRTEQDIEESAHRLAIEVKNFLNSIDIKQYEVSFVCHSMGGLIARASLKYLQSHKSKFNHMVTICSPHLGYLYHSSALISTSLWILNKVRKDPSMLQLTMSDHLELQKTFIYELSLRKELNWFKHIWLFGSKQDEYVPYWSAILEDKNFIIETQAAKIYKQLLLNITKEIEEKIIRCEIIYNEKSKDLSNFIGRTAHIKLLNYIPGIQLFSSVFIP